MTEGGLWGSATRLAHLARRLVENSIYFSRTGYWHDGERVNPDFKDANFLNHRKVYQFVSQCVADQVVLDVGCGTGYGSAILAQQARQVVGIDYSAAAIRFARRRYPKPDFRVMNAQDLRFPRRNSTSCSLRRTSSICPIRGHTCWKFAECSAREGSVL